MANAPWYIGGEFAEPQQAAPRSGMFGGGRNWGRLAADFLTNFSASMGNPAALSSVQNRFQLQQEQRQAAQREQARRAGLVDQFSLWQREQEYRQSHPDPVQPNEFERAMTAGGYAPGSPDWIARSRQRADNLANPMTAIDVQQPDGSVVRQWVRPGAGASPTGPVVTDPTGWVPAGGATPGSRPFR